METPKYIISALRGAEFYFGENCVPGYSIKIRKRTKYEYATTLRSRVDRILTWCNKQVGGSAEMISCPGCTNYTDQFAVITIYDPVMLRLEGFIKAATR